MALIAPYMHNGSVPTLAAAVEREVYYRGLEAGRPLVLTPQEKADLVAFLAARARCERGAAADTSR